MTHEGIKERLENITPGPWMSNETEVFTFAPNLEGGEVHTVQDSYPRSGYDPIADAEFIAHAPEDIRHLLAENMALTNALVNIAKETYRWSEEDVDTWSELRIAQHRGRIIDRIGDHLDEDFIYHRIEEVILNEHKRA